MPRARSGFTLIELLIVIGIIGVLAALLFPAWRHVRGLSREGASQAMLRGLQTAIVAYEADYARFPADMGAVGPTNPNANRSQNLVFCLARPGSRGTPYYEFRRLQQGSLAGGAPAKFVNDLLIAGDDNPANWPCFYSPIAVLGNPQEADTHMVYYRENMSEVKKTGLYNLRTYDLWTGGVFENAPGADDDERLGGRTHPENSRINNW